MLLPLSKNRKAAHEALLVAPAHCTVLRTVLFISVGSGFCGSNSISIELLQTTTSIHMAQLDL